MNGATILPHSVSCKGRRRKCHLCLSGTTILANSVYTCNLHFSGSMGMTDCKYKFHPYLIHWPYFSTHLRQMRDDAIFNFCWEEKLHSQQLLPNVLVVYGSVTCANGRVACANGRVVCANGRVACANDRVACAICEPWQTTNCVRDWMVQCYTINKITSYRESYPLSGNVFIDLVAHFCDFLVCLLCVTPWSCELRTRTRTVLVQPSDISLNIVEFKVISSSDDTFVSKCLQSNQDRRGIDITQIHLEQIQ